MKTLFYSTKDFEQPFLEAAGGRDKDVSFIREALSLQTVSKAKGFDIISIFTGDDASSNVIASLYQIGVKFIAIRAAGYDNVDIKKARDLGIAVANAPEYSPYAIAEHAVTLILALNRKIIVADRQVHYQNFTVDNLVGFDLKRKTVGIIGVGKIGSVLVKIMHGFGCRILGYDIHENEELKIKFGLEYVDLPTLCRETDIISIHTCLTPQTKHILNTKLVNLMKRGVMIINTSRGGCVHTADIIAGLENGRIGYYGADV
ncbi:MAG TPA: NAD(P)-dependent oxidoreductase, partial [Chitinophagaceae bacterium]|nr:NAD(P)-dependent oxidoreductase [Chitinophagaceae bacterium]